MSDLTLQHHGRVAIAVGEVHGPGSTSDGTGRAGAGEPEGGPFGSKQHPGRRIPRLWASFSLGIPTPMPVQTAPLWATLEHIGRGSEPQGFSFSDFRGVRK